MCHIPLPGRPCQLCERTSRQCTFFAEPVKKSGKASSSATRPLYKGPGNNLQLNGESGSGESARSRLVAILLLVDADASFQAVFDSGVNSQTENFPDGYNDLGALPVPLDILETLVQDVPFDVIHSDSGWPALEGPECDGAFGPDAPIDVNVLFDPMDSPEDVATCASSDALMGSVAAEPMAITSKQSESNFEDYSFDQHQDFSSQIFGFTNESDPYLLNCFPVDTEDELKFFRLIYRKMEDNGQNTNHTSTLPSSGEVPPTHFLRSHRQTVTHTVEMVDSYLSGGGGSETDAAELLSLVDLELGSVLIRL